MTAHFHAKIFPAMTDAHAAFAASIPQRYDEYLGPLLFEPYAADLASRLRLDAGDALLELACGTGMLTQHLVAGLPRGASLTATDLNEAMLAIAQKKIDQTEPVTWEAADPCALPFGDDWFDAVVCQFGLRFFPDKPQALREARRVLHPGGSFLFNVWDSPAENPLGRIADQVIARFFKTDPPGFYTVPFGMSDVGTIKTMLHDAGFALVESETKAITARSISAHHAATGLVTGSPVAHAIHERATASPEVIIAAVSTALAAEGGEAPLALPMRAHIFTARRS
jgi:ubiquinone/menaquinone biosynthesis C-methylase UbiE